MTTQKVVTDIHVWDAIGRYLFPAGIPPASGASAGTDFLAGYPDAYIDPMTLEWAHDFSQAEEDAWDRLLKWARRQAEYDDATAAAMEPYIDVLKIWKNRAPGSETIAQISAVMDAMVELWRLELRDD